MQKVIDALMLSMLLFPRREALTEHTNMQIELSDLQKQVDRQISARLDSICNAEWKNHATNNDGKIKKKIAPFSYSHIVKDLLQLRQCLYSGASPQDVSAAMQEYEISSAFLKSKQIA